MLLIIEALLLILAALGQDHRNAAAGQIFPLDMAPNSVDDNYDSCTKEMANLVKTKYLEKEMSDLPEFKKSWQEGEVNATAPEDNLTRNHSIAIYMYTNSGFNVYRDFNNAVRSDKDKYKNNTYEWYSLHFLLTEAIQILNKTQNKCFSTYRGTNLQFNKDVLNTTVRFGQFASSSLNRTVTEVFGNASCFEIKTCEGANLTKYSKFPYEEEVLIPPYEMFKVTAVKRREDQKDLWCETVFVLNSTGIRSDVSCVLCNRGSQAAVFNVLLILTTFCKVLIS
ncbi:ecto-ADP-ribosyltransferase 5-like isoform X1 [Labeo rohita]|uniref:ecto-ADP-ribosyltransferase 5-like isoform X1 n=1 Tax=Labeo rohita TaxID=84645 RepID=UPI0021E23B51|nr:ecto-ADP-ribosyltransferase 5-like isoform X1 [Labeo rohita]XP_050961670.1 ecto-ADP-ribosyltransferase 5-like isoform X1 [Labeo rohita]